MDNRTVVEESPIVFIASATDPDLPANTLTFSLDAGAPAGSRIDAKTGAFSWTPSENQGPGVFTITVRVTDSGSADTLAPTLSDSKSFTVTVEPGSQEIPPPMIVAEWDGTRLVLKWSTVVGARYKIQFKRALDEAVWTDLAGETVGDGSQAQRSENPSAVESSRFYGVIAAPSN